jgi:uncharacterized protein YecE (DUF72 family)
MRKQPLQSLDFGACGLEPADWSLQYYPDDLPADWRMAYYANEFKQIFIPAAQWPGQGAELAEWSAEAGADFRFYLEITRRQLDAAHRDELSEQLHQLNCAAVVRDESLADTLQGIVRRVDLLLENEVLLRPLWQNGTESRQLAVLHSDTALNPMQLRELFESFQHSAQCAELVVFLDAPYQSVEKMRQMCELYGW